MSIKYKIIFVSIFSLCSTVVKAGDSQGNGGDNRAADYGAAWFLGSAPIRYCVEISGEFGVPLSYAENAIARSFKEWRNYITNKRINDLVYADDPFYNGSSSPVSRFKIIGNSELLPRCDGSEELTFYLGFETDLVKQIKAQYTKPTAFAHRTSYNGQTGRGAGFIWIAAQGSLGNKSPNWQLPHRLNGMFLHEIGHVLGNEHVHNTIMDADLGIQVLWPDITEQNSLQMFTKIDGGKELFLCDRCPSSYEADAEVYQTFPDIVKKLTGRNPIGKVRVQVSDERQQWFMENFSIQIEDDAGTFKLPIDNGYTTLAMHFGDAAIFKKAANIAANTKIMESAHLTTASVSYLRTLKTTSGERIQVVLNRNMGIRAMTLSRLTSNSDEPIFYSVAPKL